MCKQPEPAPNRCYAPKEYELGLRAMGIEWLGDTVTSPGALFQYRVFSGPCCRLYFGNGKPEPHSFESAWLLVGNDWRKSGCNYLSYLTDNNDYITVRWQPPQKIEQMKVAV